VGTALHYPLPLHLQKCFEGLGYKAGSFPVSEAAAETCLSLPIYPGLTDAQVEYVASAVGQFKDW
jgi:dTDP-4-amino-4,6-dideoxygalactose transaminase